MNPCGKGTLEVGGTREIYLLQREMGVVRDTVWREHRYVGGIRTGILANIIYALRESDTLNYFTAVIFSRCDFCP